MQNAITARNQEPRREKMSEKIEVKNLVSESLSDGNVLKIYVK